jgi:hypothetical protein
MRTTVFVSLFLTLAGCSQEPTSHLKEIEALVEAPFWSVDKPGDEALTSGHALSPYFVAAKAKQLPANYFRDIIKTRGAIRVRRADWPSFQPGLGGGTISHPKVGAAFSEWRNSDWSSFYNELYHAWWASVFSRSAQYAADRDALLTSARRTQYRRAHPTDPLLAQEEAYSETIATLMIYLYPKYNPNAASGTGFYELADYPYNQNRTVSPVSHSDRPGYTPEAETTFPDPAEYAVIFRQLTDSVPPQ